MHNKIMQTVKETQEFIHCAKGVWDDDERAEFIDWIATHADAGDVIVGTKALRKVRFARQGMGKSGGARVIYFNRRADGVIILLLVYAKAKFDNIKCIRGGYAPRTAGSARPLDFVGGHGWQRPTTGLCGPERLAAPSQRALRADMPPANVPRTSCRPPTS